MFFALRLRSHAARECQFTSSKSCKEYVMMSRFLSIREFCVGNSCGSSGMRFRVGSVIMLIIINFGLGLLARDCLAAQVLSDENSQCRALEGVVNLNRADHEALMLLPGIGPKIAADILSRRQRRPFLKIRQIRRIRGVGPKKFRQIRDFLSVTGNTNLRVAACAFPKTR